MKKLDLGTKPMKLAGPTPVDAPEGGKEPEMQYPTLHIDHDEPLDGIPDEGESIIKHKVVHRGYDKPKNGKPRHRVTLEVHSITPHKSKHHKRSRLPDREDDERAVDEGLGK